jgi:thiosulfate/3-mercaptopyruvate sulfurtransferase
MARLLISTEELVERYTHGDVRIIDCRWYLDEPDKGRSEYHRGHLPGAAYASLDTDLSAAHGPGRHPLPSPDAFAATLTQFGITESTPVVAYDDRGGAIASRLWWMLTNQGHTATSVLDGGLQAWTTTGHATTTEEPIFTDGSFGTRPWRGVVDRDAVASRGRDVILVDARSIERYRGDEEPVDAKAGHIPGAISLPQTDNLSEDLSFLSPMALRSRYSLAGFAEDSDVVVHCGSGVTACHNILAMAVAGFNQTSLYVGSWSDWSSTDLPTATGDLP